MIRRTIRREARHGRCLGNAMAFAAFAVVTASAGGEWAAAGEGAFNFREEIFGEPSSLGLTLLEIDQTTGRIVLGGGDWRGPTIPFTFDWGDGEESEGFFNQEHRYADTRRNFVISVTAHYSDGKTGSARACVRFVPPVIVKVELPSALAVTIPSTDVTLDTRLYPPPGSLSHFDESFFGIVPRDAVEYILTVAAAVQVDLARGDVYYPGGDFRQVVLRDSNMGGGMYSLWFTSPVSFASGDDGFRGTLGFSSFFHEMGHNVTLNSPAAYYYGGKIDGNANAILSETLAQIFQHATAYEILNAPGAYGLGEDILEEIRGSAVSSVRFLRQVHDQYLAGGMPFSSWNHPATPADETFGTFMTLAFRFLVHAEQAGGGYRIPAQRMMEMLQLFDEDLRSHYDQHQDTPQAAAFRATLLVAALSHAFSADLRSEFRALAFPIDDGVYDALFVALSEKKPEFVRTDANGDGELDVSDAVLILLVLFAGAQADCPAAGDANDDGELNVSDPIHLLQYLFLGAEPPRSPFPDCGVDPTADLLTCPVFKGCL